MSQLGRRRPPAPWLRALGEGGQGTMHETVRDELRAVILTGRAAPGATIPVDDVAERYAISRIPVREALKTLIGEGLVEHEARAGYLVTRLSRRELAELFVVRGALENAALAVAPDCATAADDAQLESAYHGLSQAVAAGDTTGHHRESRRFHMSLTVPCGMHRLQTMLESAWNLTEPQQPMASLSSQMSILLQQDHQQMLAAFLRRDAPGLIELSTRHYGRLQEVVAALPDTRLRN